MKSLYQWGRLSLGLLPFFALAGCTDLDTAPQGDTVTEAQKAELYRRVPERASAAVNGVMSIFSLAWKPPPKATSISATAPSCSALTAAAPT